MDNLGLLDRAVVLAGDMGVVKRPQPTAAWRLVAQVRGSTGDSRQLGAASSFSDARKLALAISDLGLLVTVLDAENRVRLRMWPPLHD